MRVAQFLDAPSVAAAGEGRGEEGLDARFRHLAADEPSAQRDHVGVVMLAGEAGGERLGHERGTASRMAVDRDRDADARAAESYALGCLAGGYRLGEAIAVIGIIDRRGAIRPVLARYTDQISARSSARTPFQTVS